MRKSLTLVAIAVVASGCTLLDGKSRRLDVADGNGVSLDITRRAVLVAKYPYRDSNGDTVEGRKDTIFGPPPLLQDVRVCAEPSPDAMTTLAAQLSGSASTPQGVNAELAASLSESGAYVGLRTQSIQLLRDAMYRSCEAYLSGGIDKNAYELLLRRHQRYMLALLSIESLTGTVRAPTVTISTESMASAARSLSSLRTEIATIDAKVAALEAEKTTKSAELTGPPAATGAKKTELETRISAIDAEIKALGADKKLLEEAVKNASGLLAGGTTSVAVSNVGIGAARSDAHVQAVASAVVDITRSLTDSDDFGAKCLDYLSTSQSPDDTLKTKCEERLTASSDIMKAQVSLLEELTKKVNNGAMPPGFTSDLIKLLESMNSNSVTVKSMTIRGQ